MKTRILCLLLALALLLPMGGLAATEEEKAWPIAVAAIESELGMSMEELVLYHSGVWNLGFGDTSWAFSFRLKEPKETHENLVQVAIKPDGSIDFIQGPREYSLEELFMNQFRKVKTESPTETYTVENLAAFKQEWAPHLPQMAEEINNRERGRLNGWDYAIFALNQDICLPTEDVISIEAARKLADEYVLAMPEWTQAHLDMMERYFEIYYISQELNKPVYAFAFSQLDVWNKKYNGDWDYYEKNYLKPLYATFGGDNSSTPLFVTLRIDAKTGELIESVHMEFPPVETNEFAIVR
jgi:hypothetical protein